LRIAPVDFFNDVELSNAFSAKMQLAPRLTLAYPFQTTRVGGVAVSRQNRYVNCTNRAAAKGQQSQSGRKSMVTKKKARKTKKGKKLRKVKKLEATKPLEYYKIHMD
jgi:hypothetical protein